MSSGPPNIPPKKPDFDNAPPPQPIKKESDEMQPIYPGMRQFEGMEFTQMQWTKFLSQLMNMMMSQIKHDNDEMLKAIRKLREQDQE